MKSKWKKLWSVLLTVIMTVSLLLQPGFGIYAAENGDTGSSTSQTVADPVTIDKWIWTQGKNTATMGRIWADKSVSSDSITYGNHTKLTVEKSEAADFLVALSALSSTQPMESETPVPLDIIMVLDVSGSMDDPFGRNDSTKRLTALKNSVNAFIDLVEERNKSEAITDDSQKSRISLVQFAGKKKDSEYYEDGNRIQPSKVLNSFTVCDTNGADKLKRSVSGLRAAGMTRADYGMSLAETEMDSSARKDAHKVVIFFTDGAPSSFSSFDYSVAKGAVESANRMKASGTTVYTIGIFSGADTSDTSKKENQFMHAVSSNYLTPSVSTGSYLTDPKITLGTRVAGSEYYLKSENAEGLMKNFEDIFTKITVTAYAPTEIGGDNPSQSGYVTFRDELGAFMEVADFNAVAYGDHIYKVHEKGEAETLANGNVRYRYTFTEEAKQPANSIYADVDLRNILITVTKKQDGSGDLVEVKIPATMLPLWSYEVKTDKAEKTTLTITDTDPINVFYSVQLQDGVREAIEQGNPIGIDALNETQKQALKTYVAEHTDENGMFYLYSNLFTGTKGSDENGRINGDTEVTFSPATTNSFYYYTEDTPLYIDQSCTTPASGAVEFGKTYYYKWSYYDNKLLDDDPNADILVNGSIRFQLNEGNDTSVIGNDADGNLYVKKGTLKGSMPRALDNQLGGKDENTTDTAGMRINFEWQIEDGIAHLFLGNNGRLGFAAAGDLQITKNVEAETGMNPNTETEFSIVVNFYDPEGTEFSDSRNYEYTISRKSETGENGDAEEGAGSNSAAAESAETKTISSGGTITLKAGETAKIRNLPAGTKYQISEPVVPDAYQLKEITNGTGTIEAGKVDEEAPEAVVTNTYDPEPYVTPGDPADTEDVFRAKKALVHADWEDGLSFTFRLLALNEANPLPDDAEVYTLESQANGTAYRYVETTVNSSAPVSFGTITFTKPGVYEYDILEYIPESTGKIPGYVYSTAVFRVTVTVADDGEGHLYCASKTIALVQPGNDSLVDEADGIPKFNNVFDAVEESVNLKAKKVYRDPSDATKLEAGQFTFEVSAVSGQKADGTAIDQTEIPMPEDENGNRIVTASNLEDGDIVFREITFDENDIGNTYFYEMKEAVPADADKVPGMQYSSQVYRAKVVIGKEVSGEESQTVIVKSTITYLKQDADGNWVSMGGEYGNVIFQNELETVPATLEGDTALGVTKTLTGREWKETDEFTFTLTAKDNAPMPAEGGETAVVRGSAGGNDPIQAFFGPITYHKVGAYQYTITENDTELGGITKDPRTVNVTVQVTLKAGTNELEAAVLYDGAEEKPMFRNTYATTPLAENTNTLFKVQKVLSGREWKDTDSFQFILTGEDGAPMPDRDMVWINEYQSGQSVQIGDTVIYDAAGTYVYYITEQTGSIGGITYDRTKYKVAVEVTDNGDGTLSAAPGYFVVGENGEETPYTPETASTVVFTNTYRAGSVTLSGEENLKAEKILTGRDWGENETFRFELAAISTTADEENAVIPMPAGAQNGKAILELTKADQSGSFGDISYQTPGTYVYTISEQETGNAITSWDKSVYTITVTVTDDGSGTLKAQAVMRKDGTEIGGKTAVFTNGYDDSTDQPVKTVSKEENGTKTLIDGAMVGVGDILTYEIQWKNTAMDETGAYAPADVVITDQIPAGTALVSGSLSNGGVNENGMITWTLKNQAAGASGTVSFQVRVLESAAAVSPITNQASVTIGDHDPKVTNTITNYVPEKSVAAVTDQQEYRPGDLLTYQIRFHNTEGEDAEAVVKDILPDGLSYVTGSAKVQINGGSGAQTEPVLSGQTLTWNLTGLSENAEVTVIFQAKIEDGAPAQIRNRAFVNEYQTNVVPTTVTQLGSLTISKEVQTTLTNVDGTAAAIDADKEFTFRISFWDSENHELTEEFPISGGRTVKSGDSITLKHGESLTILGIPEGTRYTVTEDAAAGYTADETVKTGTVQGNTADTVMFVNTYRTETLTKNTSELFKVQKLLEGRSWKDSDQFTFTLSGIGNAPLPDEKTVVIGAGQADHKGQIGTSVNFDAVGTYVYEITEAAGAIGGITYDTTKYQVVVTVTDKGDGTLEASAVYATVTEGGELAPYEAVDHTVVFTNIYKAGSVTLDGETNLKVSKTLTGRAWEDEEAFQFKLTGTDGPDGIEIPMPESDTLTLTKAAPNGSFGSITYTEPGSYRYRIEEMETGNAGITWDKSVYLVTVTVTDDGSGSLKAEAVMTKNGESVSGADFTNVYDPDGDQPLKDVTKETDGTKMSVNGTLVGVGEILTYEIRWKNYETDGKGNYAPATVVITDQIPANTELVEGSVDNGGSYADGTITWTLENQDPGAEGTVSFQVKVLEGAAGAPINNQAEVKVGERDPRQTNMTSNEVPGKWDITAEGKHKPGDELTYQIMFKNTKGAEAAAVVKDLLPEGLSYVTDSARVSFNGGTETEAEPEVSGQTLTWNLSAIPEEAAVKLTFRAQINADAAELVENTAFVDDHQTNVVPTEITQLGDLTITKEIETTLKNTDGTEAAIDTERVFDFTIRLTDENGDELTDGYPTNDNRMLHSGDTIMLKHGESLTIRNIPAGSQYTVNEAAADGYTADETVKTGTVHSRETAAAAFVNTYHADTPAAVVLHGSKNLTTSQGTEKVLSDGQFTFNVYQDQACTAASLVTSAKNRADGTIEFPEIRLSQVGTYTWYMSEVDSGQGGYVYDKALYRVTVTVSDQKDGTLAASEPVYEKLTENQWQAVDAAVFTNDYHADQPETDTFDLEVKKSLTGRQMEEGEFFFTIEDENGQIVGTAENGADGSVRFNGIGLNAVQEQYTLLRTQLEALQKAETEAENEKVPETGAGTGAETNGSDSGNAPAKTEDAVESPEAEKTSEPENGAGALKGEAPEPENGAEALKGEAPEPENGAEALKGETPEPENGAEELKGEAAAQADLEADKAAEIEPAKENKAEGKKEEAVSENKSASELSGHMAIAQAAGAPPMRVVTEEEAALAETMNGLMIRWYTIREAAGNRGGVTYDPTVYKVKVPLVDDGEGTLTFDTEHIQYFAEDGVTELTREQVEFKNSYVSNEGKGVDLTITANKFLAGRILKDGEFTFVLTDEQGNTVTAVNDADGRILFTFHFDDQDGTGVQETHTYTLTEVNDGQDRITYDTAEHTFTVTVSDDGEGYLTAEVSEHQALEFHNTYTPAEPPKEPTPKPPVTPQTPSKPTPAKPTPVTTAPATGDETSFLKFLLLLAGSGVAMLGAWFSARRKKDS
ncbi:MULTISPECIES: Spy0128 family protein [unclassified Candidatus Paralachnospira]|uniref:Spy0128 family protein n=1 Tax=unclassified Candidatus Paralachnospira TaxID=3099471 RepID=UPI003F8DF773